MLELHLSYSDEQLPEHLITCTRVKKKTLILVLYRITTNLKAKVLTQCLCLLCYIRIGALGTVILVIINLPKSEELCLGLIIHFILMKHDSCNPKGTSI